MLGKMLMLERFIILILTQGDVREIIRGGGCCWSWELRHVCTYGKVGVGQPLEEMQKRHQCMSPSHSTVTKKETQI